MSSWNGETGDFEGGLQDSIDPKRMGERLRGYVEEAERLICDRDDVNLQLRAVFDAAKESGFSPKAMRELIKRRAMDPRVRADFDATLEVYETVVGLGPALNGGTLRRVPDALPAPAPKLSKKDKDMAEALAFAGVKRGSGLSVVE